MAAQRSDLASQRGRIGAFVLHATHDAREITAPARRAAATALDLRLAAQYGLEIEVLGSDEFQRRLGYARRAHFAALALRSANVRRNRKNRRTQ